MSDVPYGKGSLHSELIEATFRTRRRAKKINDGETGRLRVFREMMDRHQHAEEERKSRVIAKFRKSIEEMEAYKKVLDSYRADNFVTMRRGFKKRQINTPNSFMRYQLETKVYTCGFSVDTLYPEVERTIYNSQPHRVKEERFKKLLNVAKKRSDFMIDRRMTNDAMRREKLAGVKKKKDPTITNMFATPEPEEYYDDEDGEVDASADVAGPSRDQRQEKTFSKAEKVGKVYFKTLPPIKRSNTTKLI